MKNFAETLTRVISFASTENWMDCGDYLIFGWDEYIEETGDQALDPIKQEGLNPGDLGRALFQIKQAWVSQSLVNTLSPIFQHLDTEVRRYCLELGTAQELVERLPGIVRRCEHLNVLTVDAPSGSNGDQILTAYFREATLCYLLGLNSASVLLLRSTLEFGIEATLLRVNRNFYFEERPENKGKLEWYIDRAYDYKIFKVGAQKRAHKIRKLANDVAHEKEILDEKKTRIRLEHGRGLIQLLLGIPGEEEFDGRRT